MQSCVVPPRACLKARLQVSLTPVGTSRIRAHLDTAPERGCVADQPQQLRETGRLEFLSCHRVFQRAAAGASHTAALRPICNRGQCQDAPGPDLSLSSYHRFAFELSECPPNLSAMSNREEAKLARWPAILPFLVGAVLFDGLGWWIMYNSVTPITQWVAAAVVICVGVGAWVSIMPFIWDARSSLKLDELDTLEKASRQIWTCARLRIRLAMPPPSG